MFSKKERDSMSSKQLSAFQRKRRKDNIAGYAFLIPAMIAFLLFVGGPMIISFVLSFFDYNLIQPPAFTGLKNIRKFMMDPQVKISFANTFKFLLILVPVHCFLGMLLAFAVSCVHHKKMQTVYRSILYFPTVVTTASVAIVWGYMFGTDTGVINYFVRQMGGSNVPWLTDKVMVYVTIAVFSFWKFIGTTFLYYFIGLQNIPDGYYEAAKIDGANTFQIFRKITLPLLSPTMFFVIVTNIIGVFQIFEEPFIITNGGPGTATKTVSFYIYEIAFKQVRTGYGCLVAFSIFLVILVVTVIQFAGQKRWVTYDYE